MKITELRSVQSFSKMSRNVWHVKVLREVNFGQNSEILRPHICAGMKLVSGQKPPGHKPPDKNPLDKNPPDKNPPDKTYEHKIYVT